MSPAEKPNDFESRLAQTRQKVFDIANAMRGRQIARTTNNPAARAVALDDALALSELAKAPEPLTRGEWTAALQASVLTNHAEHARICAPFSDCQARFPNGPEAGLTPLMDAAAQGSAQIVAILIPRSDLDACDELGETALHKAAGRGRLDCLQQLLAAGARSTPNLKGRAPLHCALAAVHDRLDCARALLPLADAPDLQSAIDLLRTKINISAALAAKSAPHEAVQRQRRALLAAFEARSIEFDAPRSLPDGHRANGSAGPPLNPDRKPRSL